MQLFHLQFILTREPADLHLAIRANLEELHQKFLSITLYSTEQLTVRETKMRDYIHQFEQQLK